MPTHSSYLDVAGLSEKLYLKYWADCPFKIVLSTNISDTEFSFFLKHENFESDEYIRRIKNASDAFHSDYYLIIGEDNFITYKIDIQKIKQVLDYMDEHKVNYCRLIPPEKKSSKLRFYQISESKPYGITGAGFFCTKEYIDKEFSENINGWQFENEMLRKTMTAPSGSFFSDCVACSQDVLNTVHGIRHGMWIPKSYRLLKSLNPELNFDVRPIANENLSYFIHEKMGDVYKMIPTKTRFKIKRVLKSLGFKFATDF